MSIEKELALEKRVRELEGCLSELADLMDDVVANEYEPDRFTTQPARKALSPVESESPKSKEDKAYEQIQQTVALNNKLQEMGIGLTKPPADGFTMSNYLSRDDLHAAMRKEIEQLRAQLDKFKSIDRDVYNHALGLKAENEKLRAALDNLVWFDGKFGRPEPTEWMALMLGIREALGQKVGE